MVADTSAILAILLGEPERRRFAVALEDADSVVMSAASFVECSIVVECRYGAEGIRDLDRLLARAGIECVAVDLEQARMARDAFSRYGKGRHRAGLNFGDCFSYALAMDRGEPLLFKGDDFGHTDALCFE